jgi:putative NADH-flavin reductase
VGHSSALLETSRQTVSAAEKYILAGEELTLNSKGESIISYADYAIAMVDEIEKG